MQLATTTTTTKLAVYCNKGTLLATNYKFQEVSVMHKTTASNQLVIKNWLLYSKKNHKIVLISFE